ncbi:MAG: HD domain-containing protein [Desulforegulaceae bacterium]|nr:HD domain-containing protein [Desulforegulaceae bacterium]
MPSVEWILKFSFFSMVFYGCICLLGISKFVFFNLKYFQENKRKRKIFERIKTGFLLKNNKTTGNRYADNEEEINFIPENELKWYFPLKDNDLQEFWHHAYLPNIDWIFALGHDQVFRDILLWLDSLPDYQSVFPSDKFYGQEYDLIKKVSLKKHLLNVACCVLETLKNEKSVNTSLATIAALLHDVGKIPDLWEGEEYKSKEHPSKGVDYIEKEKILKNLSLEEKNAVLSAIEGHHDKFFSAKNITVLKILKDADSKARQMETEMFQGDKKDASKEDISLKIVENCKDKDIIPKQKISIKRQFKQYDLSWLQFDDFFLLVHSYMNCNTDGPIPSFFSFGEYVYIAPRRLAATIKEIAVKSKAVNISILSNEDDFSLVNSFLNLPYVKLKNKKDLYFSMEFDIFSKNEKVLFSGLYYTVFDKDFFKFDDWNEIERRKEGSILHIIGKIEPVAQKNKKKG